MNIETLKSKLVELSVNPQYYSLNEGIKIDALVLNENYGNWDTYYLDERGNKHDELTFKTENEACEYVYLRFKKIEEIKRSNLKINRVENDDLPDVINL